MARQDKPFDEQIFNSAMDYWRLSVEENKRGFAELTQAIDRLTGAVTEQSLNIAQLTTQQKATAVNLDKLGDRLDRITSALEQQILLSQNQAQIIASQTANIAELTRLLTVAIASKS